jgi:four helix bundle protein
MEQVTNGKFFNCQWLIINDMKENIVKNKSFTFAVRIVKLYQYLCENKREFVLSKQLLRSGTSVGAMIREAEHAETKNDFKHKLAIAQKEINETIYWLELLKETAYLNDQEFISINEDATEIIKLLTTIIKSVKSNIAI